MYCKRCNKHHSNLLVDPDKIVNMLGKNMANHIDLLVIKELNNNTAGAISSMRDLKINRKGDRGVK